jgi:signal transduction histidine kinase
MEGLVSAPRMSDRTLQSLGALLAMFTLVVGIASSALSLTRGTTLLPRVAPTTLTDILLQGIPLVVVLLVGAFLVWRVPRNTIGWILLVLAATATLEQFATEYAYLALLRQPGRWPLGEFAAWAGYWLFAPGQWTVPLVLLLFPTGRPLSPRWRWVVGAAVVLAALNTMGWMLLPTSAAPAGSNPPPFSNPTGQPFMADLAPVVFATSGPAIVAFALLGILSTALRYHRSDADGRHQLKWFLYTGPLLAIGFAVGFFTPNSTGPAPVTPIEVINTLLTVVGTVAVPVAIAIAILKYRLYDIDVIISRTLVYGSLAALITGVYVGIAVGMGELVGSGGKPNLGLSILATAIVALGFQPARERLQRVANRLVYGKRATPYQVLSEFSSHVAGSYAADEVLPRMARVLQEGTAADLATVWLRGGDALHVAAEFPPRDHAAPISAAVVVDGVLPGLPGVTRAVEVRHQGELLGALSVLKRRGETLTPVEEKLLGDLAHQAGLVLKNVRLSADLQRRLDELRASRQRLVSAQDAERRRLERNLHDGAQQHLVALKVKIGLAEMLAAKDPDKASATIAQLKHDTDEALETLRDLARGIYPPLLAEKGLATALESQARKATLPVSVEAEGLTRYPQEVEATVYFCVLEALQNVQKYAHASHATVRLHEVSGALQFEVEDDGRGFDTDHVQRGSGLTNMMDRADAAGGSLTITSRPGRGCTLSAELPLVTGVSTELVAAAG